MGPTGAQGAPGVSGYATAVASLGQNTTTTKTVTATCAAGGSVVGGGFATNLTSGGYVLQNGPASASSWTVSLREAQAGTPNWTLTVTAICVTALP